MSNVGRQVRLGVTVVVVALTIATNFFGKNDYFPFAPFSMYADTRHPDDPVEDTGVYGIDARGREINLDDDTTGIRRAEIEGQIPAFEEDPDRAQIIADAYHKLNPQAPPITKVVVYVDWIQMDDGVPTGKTEREVLATWTR